MLLFFKELLWSSISLLQKDIGQVRSQNTHTKAGHKRNRQTCGTDWQHSTAYLPSVRQMSAYSKIRVDDIWRGPSVAELWPLCTHMNMYQHILINRHPFDSHSYRILKRCLFTFTIDFIQAELCHFTISPTLSLI